MWGARCRSLLLLGLSAALLTGCSGTNSLLGPGPQPKSAAARDYLVQLSSAQGGLAKTEQKIPTRSPTPAALSSAISLLAKAMGTLASGLEAIKPPQQVAGLHRRLVAIARGYRDRLSALAREARNRNREVAAANALAVATSAASSQFTTTFAEIRAQLAR